MKVPASTETDTPAQSPIPVLRPAPNPAEGDESIPVAISALANNASEVGSWFEANRIPLQKCGTSALISMVVFFAILLTLRHVISKGAAKLSEGLGKFIHKLSMHIALLFLFTGLSYSNSLIDFPGHIDQIIDKIFFALFILIFLAGILNFINAIDNVWSQRFRRRNQETYATSKLMLDLLRRLIKTVVWFIAILFILQNLFHVEITPLITGAGVVGVAVAFAAQNTIANLFGAFSILGSQLFKVGDWIKIGDAEGTVEQIGLRSIRVRAFEGRVIDIPNRVIADTQLDNFSNRAFYREPFRFDLVYQTSPEQMRNALAIIEEICKEMADHMLPDHPARFAFTECATYSLRIQGYVWFNTTNWYTLQDYKGKFNMAVLQRFNDAGLSFAYPTSTLFMQKGVEGN